MWRFVTFFVLFHAAIGKKKQTEVCNGAFSLELNLVFPLRPKRREAVTRFRAVIYMYASFTLFT